MMSILRGSNSHDKAFVLCIVVFREKLVWSGEFCFQFEPERNYTVVGSLLIRCPSSILSGTGPGAGFTITGIRFAMALSMAQHKGDQIILVGGAKCIDKFCLGRMNHLPRFAIVIFLHAYNVKETVRNFRQPNSKQTLTIR